MQPDDKRARLQKATLPRCRMVLKTYLPFLPGFPVPCGLMQQPSAGGIQWYSFRENAEVLLMPESIRLANIGWNELRKFPQVFPQAVEDVEAWQRVVPWVLAQLGKAVYGKTQLPDALWSFDLGFSASDLRHIESLEKSQPKLKPFLNAVSWLTALHPEQLAPILRWVETEDEKIVNILENWPGSEGIRLALLLFGLVEMDGSQRIAPILETLGTQNARTVPTDMENYRREWNTVITAIAQRTRTPKSFNKPLKEFTLESPAKPDGDWADAVRDFTLRIADQPTKKRRLSLELFAENIPPRFMERWHNWWDEMEPVIQSAEKLVTRVRQGTYEDNEKRSRQAKGIQRRFGELYHIAPPTINYFGYTSEQILDMFMQWDNLSWKPYLKSICALTRTLSVDHRQQAPRLKTLVGLHGKLVERWGDTMRSLDISLILDEFRRWDIPQHDLPSVIRFWWPDWYGGDRDELRRIGKALRYWFVDLDQGDGFGDVVDLAKAIGDEAKIYQFSRVLARPEHRKAYYWDTMIQTAARLADNEKEFSQLLVTARKIGNEEEGFDDGDMANLVALTQFLVDTPWRNDLRAVLLNNEASSVLEVADSAAALAKRKISVPLPVLYEAASTEWMRQFPDSFTETLHRLAALTPRAEQIALRKLEPLVFNPTVIQAEIDLLERRLRDFPDNSANARIQTRIGNLRKRLEAGHDRNVSESRLRHLHTKLDERVRRIFFEQLRYTANELLEQTICKGYDLDTFPPFWKEPLHRKIALGVLDLDRKPVKRLGIKLLRSLVGVATWDFHNEPENVKFLQRLQRLGIRLEPWLFPALPEKHRPVVGQPVGQPLMFGFETTPWEVLKMGAPFKTCLSPWEFNFFSTIANAVDINKHVLYGRDVKGTIQARCLIALTDNGELLAFHPYAHDSNLGFREIVSEYLNRLAGQMNTVVIDTGSISNLVSPEWYDDGSIAISELFAFLRDGSAFRKKLADLEPACLLAELEKELAPHPLRAFVLPPLLELPEINQRPELLFPLLPFVSSSLSLTDLETMIKLIDRAGGKREAMQLAKRYLIPRMERLFHNFFWRWKNVAYELVKIVPDAFLPHIRRLGKRATQKPDDEQETVCRELLALIYETQGRKRKVKRVD